MWLVVQRGRPWLLLLAALRLCSALDDSFAVAAYLPEWRYDGANWESISKHVTHLILFSLVNSYYMNEISVERSSVLIGQRNIADIREVAVGERVQRG